jgi:PadR family transcriptional regulator, regulatory protein PadR
VAVKLRLSPQTLKVLEVFLAEPREWQYGYDISRMTGLKSGSLYPILMRLAERGLLDTEWETNEAGKPPRHLYRLTPNGLQLARERRPKSATMRQRRMALSGAEG